MAENITITANWLDGSLSNGMISRQYDNNRYRVQFINYPLGEDEDLSLYLIVWMKTEENGQSVEQAPIELDSDQWIVTNYYTQFVQNIQFQLCVRNQSGTFEAHSPIFNSNVTKSLSHDGSTQEIYVDPLFDAYKEYVDDLVIGAGAVVIDSDLDTAGAAADAKATGDAVAELNERLVKITDTTIGENKFDQRDDYEITTGKYLNPSTGNYGAHADFIVIENYLTGIEAGKKYWAEYFQKNTLAKLGPYHHFVCFYDSNKQFISGFEGGLNVYPITAPENTAYYRVSLPASAYSDRYLMITEGEAEPVTYAPYEETISIKVSALPNIPKSYVIVDINGHGNFTSINEAVQSADNDATILIMPGEYKEQVEAWGKVIHLIGLNKETTILWDDSMDYATPPLEFSCGSIKNLTVYAKNGSATPSTFAYAMHVESHALADNSIYCENVIFKSEVNYCVGIGLRRNSTVAFKNCDFVGNGSGAGCVFFHDADSASYRGTANIVFDTCNMICDGNNYPVRVQALHDDNLTYITFKRNGVWAKTNETNNVFNTWNSGGATGDGWRGLLKMYLTWDSFGNRIPGMNYST